MGLSEQLYSRNFLIGKISYFANIDEEAENIKLTVTKEVISILSLSINYYNALLDREKLIECLEDALIIIKNDVL